jgi:hypothetical protein
MTTAEWIERLAVRLLRGTVLMLRWVFTYPRRAAKAWGELMRWVGTGGVCWLIWSATGTIPATRWLAVGGLLIVAHRHGREPTPPGDEPTPLDGEEADQSLAQGVGPMVGEGFSIIADEANPQRSHVVWHDGPPGDEGTDQ